MGAGDGGGGLGRAEDRAGVVADKPAFAAFINVFPFIACVTSSDRRRYLSIFCLIGVLIELFGRR
jgi:hypothetical protein